jgi:hypothetical protein
VIRVYEQSNYRPLVSAAVESRKRSALTGLLFREEIMNIQEIANWILFSFQAALVLLEIARLFRKQ